LQAQADLQNARATLAASKADLAKAQATATQATQDYQRTANLARQGILSQQQLDAAKATADADVAAVNSGKAQVGEGEAQVQLKTAAVKVAQTNLNYTTIRAPIDGTVTARNVDVGQTVAASLQAPTLFSIAQDLTKMRVYAKSRTAGQLHCGRVPQGSVSRDRGAGPHERYHRAERRDLRHRDRLRQS
jgi:HlyD family secretion protein